MEKRIISGLHTIVTIGLILTIIFLLLFPLLFTGFIKELGSSHINIDMIKMRNIGLISFYILSIPYLGIIINTRRITKLFKDGDLFNRLIVRLTKVISILSFSIGIIYIVINLVLYFKFKIYLYSLTILPIVIITFISLFLGVLFLVISFIYNKVICIKEENDMTI